MLGLIIKDALMLKKQYYLFILFFAVYLVIGILNPDFNSALTTLMVIVFAALPITALTYDDVCKWNKYAIALPLTRNQIVGAKYLFGGLSLVFGLVIATIFNLVLGIFRPVDVLGSVLSLGVAAIMSLLVLAINMPLNFRFGGERSRIIMILCCILPFCIMMAVLDEIPGILTFISTHAAVICIGALLLVVAAVAGSFYLSCRIYDRKAY